MGVVIPDVNVVDTERRSAVHGIEAVSNQFRPGRPGVNIREEGGDDLPARACQAKRSVRGQAVVEGDVAVVVDIDLRTVFAEEIDVKAQRLERAGAVVVPGNAAGEKAR